MKIAAMRGSPNKTINPLTVGPFLITPTIGAIVDPDTSLTVSFIRAFLCTADCYVTLVDLDGITRTDVPFTKGWNVVAATQVHACNDAAGSPSLNVPVWGGY